MSSELRHVRGMCFILGAIESLYRYGNYPNTHSTKHIYQVLYSTFLNQKLNPESEPRTQTPNLNPEPETTPF